MTALLAKATARSRDRAVPIEKVVGQFEHVSAPPRVGPGRAASRVFYVFKMSAA
jgi:hypothetical protein